MTPYKNIALVVLIISLLSLVSAVSCDKSAITKNAQTGTTISSETIHCTRDANESVIVSYVGEDFLSTNPATNFLMNPSEDITISFTQGLSSGTYTGFLTLGSTQIPIKLNLSTPIQQQTGCQINPTLISYTQSIQQGTKMNLPKITFSPTNCPGDLTLTASSVSIQGGILTPTGQKPIYISSIVADGINLGIDSTDLTTQQTYTSYLTISAYNKQFQIPFTIVVTSGTSPIIDFDPNNLPSCTLTTNTLNLNSTYALTCSKLSPDVTITPRIDTRFINGIGLETSINQYIWKFKPVLSGDTVINADFYYRGSPVGSPFTQSVKIQSSTNNFPGNKITLAFNPNMDKIRNGDQVIIQVTDNRTGSLLDNSELYINSIKLNGTDDSTFSYIFLTGKDYNLRARSPGYDDLVMNFKINEKFFNITMNPSSGDGDTIFNITTDAVNASIFINGQKSNYPYFGALPEGHVNIKFIQEGYVDEEINVTIEEALRASIQTEFEDNKIQVYTLNKNVSWYVLYQKDANDQGKTIANGTGSKIEFTPKNSGIYSMYGGDKFLDRKEINGWDGKLFGIDWYWIGGATILVLGFLWYRGRNKSSSNDMAWASAPVNTG